MNINVNGTFRFHNVGQGLFYSGILSKKDNGKHDFFSFVYDCGTYSATSFLQREIDDYKLLLPTTGISKHKKLDLLVISHLHDDHVNGLEYLLKDIEVDTVVMPYTNDNLNLLAQLESHSDDEFLRVFYTDPIAWFVSKDVHRILLIGSEEIEGEQNDSLNNQPQDISEDQQSVLKTDNSGKTEIVYLKNKTQVSNTDYYWEFCFENLRLKSSKLNLYIQIVEDFKRKKCLTREQIVKSKLLLDELRQQVKNAFPNGNILNRTSVVLLHGPNEIPSIVDVCNIYHWKCSEKCKKELSQKLAPLGKKDFCYSRTILTGDIKLNNNESLEMLNHFSICCLLVQYPHHGSGNNNIQYFIDLGAKVNVISYGIKNKYRHPHGKVLQQLSNIAFVNERESLNYRIILMLQEDIYQITKIKELIS